MSKERKDNFLQKKCFTLGKFTLLGKHCIIIGGVLLAVILAVALFLFNRNAGKNRDWATVIPGVTQSEEQGENAQNNGDRDSAVNAETGTPDGSNVSVENPVQNTDPIPTVGDEDPYENWLVSAMIVSVSMQYSDFEFHEIYTASQTPVSAHEGSAGAYLVFTADGEKMALKCVPISGERTEKGTWDLYTPTLGFATYERINVSDVPTSGLTAHKLEDLTHLISASSLVTIYEHP